MESIGVPALLLPLVIALEIGGGVPLVIGWMTRWSALALAGFCVAA
ncbi:MAG: DoxX family membrane protein, partial [Burkholderiales bacterium]|nr:DoxX family membrane protein [Burkholderiales bacterium]